MEDQDEEMDQIPEEGSNSIAMKIFSCCFNPGNKEIEINSERRRSNLIYESLDTFFPSNSIRQEEKDKIKFTKIGILEYITNMQDLVFPLLFEENGIKISKRNYTEINGRN